MGSKNEETLVIQLVNKDTLMKRKVRINVSDFPRDVMVHMVTDTSTLGTLEDPLFELFDPLSGATLDPSLPISHALMDNLYALEFRKKENGEEETGSICLHVQDETTTMALTPSMKYLAIKQRWKDKDPFDFEKQGLYTEEDVWLEDDQVASPGDVWLKRVPDDAWEARLEKKKQEQERRRAVALLRGSDVHSVSQEDVRDVQHRQRKVRSKLSQWLGRRPTRDEVSNVVKTDQREEGRPRRESSSKRSRSRSRSHKNEDKGSEEYKSKRHVKRTLASFFKRRPSKMELQKAKILPATYKSPGEAECVPLSHALVDKLCVAIAEKALTTQGVFRVSGGVLNVRRLLAELSLKMDLTKVPVHDLTGVLKLWFRESPDPLFNAEHVTELFDCMEGENAVDTEEEKLSIVFPKFDQIAPAGSERWKMFHSLFSLLRDVAAHSSETAMNASNLGIVIGPSIFRIPDELLMQNLSYIRAGNEVSTFFMNHAAVFLREQTLEEGLHVIATTPRAPPEPPLSEDGSDDEPPPLPPGGSHIAALPPTVPNVSPGKRDRGVWKPALQQLHEAKTSSSSKASVVTLASSLGSSSVKEKAFQFCMDTYSKEDLIYMMFAAIKVQRKKKGGSRRGK